MLAGSAADFTLGGKKQGRKLGHPRPLGNPKWKKGHNFPLFIAPGLAGSAADFYSGQEKTGSQIGKHQAPREPKMEKRP